MPEPPGGRGQKSIFAFPGFKKYVQVKGVLHEVVPPALDDFDAKHPLLCRWGCGERFSPYVNAEIRASNKEDWVLLLMDANGKVHIHKAVNEMCFKHHILCGA